MQDLPANIAELREAHDAAHDDGRTCGDWAEHLELFNALPNPRLAPGQTKRKTDDGKGWVIE